MARGRKRTPTELHLVRNTLNTTRHRDRIGEPVSEGRPVPPKILGEREQQLWDQFIDTAFWLHIHDSAKAYVWVHLHAEFERAPADMIAARLTQLRAIGAELGFDPSSRSRLGGIVAEPTAPDEFFD